MLVMMASCRLFYSLRSTQIWFTYSQEDSWLVGQSSCIPSLTSLTMTNNSETLKYHVSQRLLKHSHRNTKIALRILLRRQYNCMCHN